MRMTSGDALAIVAKYPTPGQVKTRLGAAIGFVASAALYRAFLADLAERFTAAQAADGYDAWWACTPSAAQLAPLLGPGAHYFDQRGEGLAERLHNICRSLRARGYRRVVLLGSDSPQLPARVVAHAFAALCERDVVLGPADDGGYYLIGLHLAARADLFRGIQMSTPHVLRETMARAHALGLTVALLEPAFDVDEVGDLARLEAALAEDDCMARHTAAALRRFSERQESAYGDLTSVG